MANKTVRRIPTSHPAKKSETDNQRHIPMGYLTIVGILVVAVSYGVYAYYNHRLQTRIVTPFREPNAVVKTGLDVPDLYWGSYRPGTYFGMKTRSVDSPVAGLMWYSQALVNNQLSIRHWCAMGDFNERYTWLHHDGQNFGNQEIYDGNIVIRTSFVKRKGGIHGGDWTSRIAVSSTGHGVHPLSLLFYVALDGEGRLKPHVEGSSLNSVIGMTSATGDFKMTFHNNGSNVITSRYLSTVTPGLDVLNEVVQSNLAYLKLDKKRIIGLTGERFSQDDTRREPNFVVHEVIVAPPFEMEVSYESTSFVERPNALLGQVYTGELETLQRRFDDHFQTVFHMKSGNFSENEIDFAKSAFSNLIGGIGYFNGHSLVKGQYNKEPLMYFRTPLYTAVPSRSFFPRGFLWDEGFHNLLIARWNVNITKDIIAHWLDTLNADGWIPREQILDKESRARVPEEFILQRDTNANPPTLFLPLRFILNDMSKKSLKENEEDVRYFARIFPRLKAWFDWFNRTQVGKLPGTYRWRGRSSDNTEELNPTTLTCGLDDYPRSSHPTKDERHVDLRCWMAFMANLMADVAKAIGEPSELYVATASYLSDNALLDALHWSPKLLAYSDYGLHSNKVRLARIKTKTKTPQTETTKVVIRVVDEDPELQFVNAFGYVSLFPFLLQILEPSSTKLGRILDDLGRPDLLWTDYGLRSLAQSSPLYQKKNRQDSPPYWRGAIWINMNYLAVEALAHYGQVDGPYKNKAREMYHRLRLNLIKNVYNEYKRTGYIWEQYNDQNGHGQRAHPFTGWSALITLMMSDEFEQLHNS